jgi:hypothetical protein
MYQYIHNVTLRGLYLGMFSLTVAGNDEELVIVRDIMGSDIGICSDDLLLRRQLRRLLELKITNSSGEREISVNSSEINKPTSSNNTCFLA